MYMRTCHMCMYMHMCVVVTQLAGHAAVPGAPASPPSLSCDPASLSPFLELRSPLVTTLAHSPLR